MSASEHFDKMEAATAAMRYERPPSRSEVAPCESAGPAKVVAAVATGCLPVSRAEVLDVVDRILRMADSAESEAQHPEQTDTRRHIAALRYCAWYLEQHVGVKPLRQAGQPIQRQPEDNGADQPRPTNAKSL